MSVAVETFPHVGGVLAWCLNVLCVPLQRKETVSSAVDRSREDTMHVLHEMCFLGG